MFVPSNRPGDVCVGDVSGAGVAGRRVRPVALPPGLASMAPGVQLADAIAGVDVTAVSGYDTVELLIAQYRQACHERALFLQTLLETGLREPHSGDVVARINVPGEFAPEEARAALLWSRRRAHDALALARDAFLRLPAVGAAMLAGDLDEPRAVAITQWTRELHDDHAAFVCDEVLEDAPALTVGALVDRIKRLAIALDPDWAERKYREVLNQRRVVGKLNADGTADVAGRNLPVDRAAAAASRIDSLARSCKNAGDARPINHIRVDLYLGMLDGSFDLLSDDEIVAHVLANPFSYEASTDEAATDQPSSGAAEGDASENEDAAVAAAGDEGDTGDEDGHEEGDDDQPSGECSPNPGSPVHPAPGGATASSPWATRELRVELTTLIGRDQHPAEIPGWGYVPAAIARHMIHTMVAGEWRFVICDGDGRAICSGITTCRPTHVRAARRDTRRGGIVEIQVRASDLSWIAAAAVECGTFPEWTAVIDDIDTRVGAADVDTDAAADEVRRRAPGAGLRRWLEVRGRACAHPACGVPATSCDQDHTIDFAHDGPTSAGNLCPACRHDHRLKTEGGWTIERNGTSLPIDGSVTWISGLGRRYESRPPPVMLEFPVWAWETIDVFPPAPLTPAQAQVPVAILATDDVPPF